MKEVEVKYRVGGIDFDECVQIVSKAANVSFSEPVFQDDSSYAPVDYDFANIKKVTNVPFLRIRRQGEQTIFTIKKPQGSLLDKIEYEVTVNDDKQLEGIISELGFKADQRVKKKRVTAHAGEYEVCIDQVEGLGLFIELESITDDDTDGPLLQQKMDVYLKNLLGDSIELEWIDRGYDVLMRQQTI